LEKLTESAPAEMNFFFSFAWSLTEFALHTTCHSAALPRESERDWEETRSPPLDARTCAIFARLPGESPIAIRIETSAFSELGVRIKR